MVSSYKEDHESFVSNNIKGTSLGCILVVLAHAPALILLLKLVQKNSTPIFLRDMIYLVIPILLSMTVLADYCYLTLVVIVFSEIFALQQQRGFCYDKVLFDSSKKPFITIFKGAHMYVPFKLYHTIYNDNIMLGANLLITTLAIIAVDFRIFPRRFSKTELFGLR